MRHARIAELLVPFLENNPSEVPNNEESALLSTAQLERISTYIDILLRWNARINLTAIRDEEQIVTRHFGESLFAARHLFPRETRVVSAESDPVVFTGHMGTAAHGRPAERSSAAAADIASETGQRADGLDNRGRAAPAGPRSDSTIKPALALEVADVGSGAGFPGIPIKLWAPQIRLTLIESNQKKATFLREVARALTLTDIDIQNVRAESLTQRFDVVTLRAVERFESALPTAARLISTGRLALLIGSAQLSHARSALPAMVWSDPHPVPASRSRVVLIGEAAQSKHEPEQ